MAGLPSNLRPASPSSYQFSGLGLRGDVRGLGLEGLGLEGLGCGAALLRGSNLGRAGFN